MAATDLPDTRLDQPSPGSLVAAMAPTALVHITVNVGDADTQLLLLPADDQGQRQLLVVDAIRADKLRALIDELDEAGVLGPGGAQVAIVVATHPHADHIRGMPSILDAYASSDPEVWEPGYRHASGMYLDILDRVAHHRLTRTVVSAGMTRFIEQTRVTVIAPGVSLQRRYDTYGVDINNSSVCLKIDYPATQILRKVTDLGATNTFVDYDIGRTLILGADAQMLSWSHVLDDFPQLGPEKTIVTQALKMAGGATPLRADVFKVPHHGSKHGLTLELVEAIKPKVSIVSSGHSGGRHQFPHDIAMAQLREAVNARATQPGVPYDPDDQLALLYTGSTVDPGGAPAGSVCTICHLGAPLETWRLMDAPTDRIDFDVARRMT